MPKVTLLEEKGCTYTLVYRNRRFFFKGAVPVDVSAAVAVEAQRKKKRNGKPKFRVEDMPTFIANTSHPRKARQRVEVIPKVPVQNVTGQPEQMGLENWL